MSGSTGRPAELTFKAVALGLFLSLIFGAANAYLGMKTGQTVAATIPAAVIAMALFRLPRFHGTILEQNIVRTAGSVGEALVAGAIFTIPAFMLAETGGHKLWTDLRSHYWEAALILLVGGLTGVFFIIALRRPLCVDAGLPWPESVASVEIVKAGSDTSASSDAPKLIFGAMALGGLIQFLRSDKGIQIFTDYIEGFWHFPQSLIGPMQATGGIPWSTPALSPALIGIGFILGARTASINVAGGVLAWWVLIPLLLVINPGLSHSNPAGPDLWRQVVRPVAVGAMLVAAASTLYGMRHSMIASIRGAWRASSGTSQATADPTEQDLPPRWVFGSLAVLLIPTALIYLWFTGSWVAAIVAAGVMMVTGFLLSAVGGYLVGLVGSSNQPVSGLTLAALLISAFFLLASGVSGREGIAAVLGVAAVVCCACCVSGSLIQDLKAGHLLGGTPWKMQVVEIAAVVILAFFLMIPILVLHEANLADGGIGGRALPAPQAGLMAQLAKGIVSGELAWGLLAIGAAMALAFLLSGARSVMLIAVGMYLPFDTTAAIFVGGAIQWFAARRLAGAAEARQKAAEERGTLIASGLIAGEAIVGILLAATVVMGVPSFTQALLGVERAGFADAWGKVFTAGGFVLLAWVLVRTSSTSRVDKT
ncbi:MAG: oligopeptide transporter, OPT family [Acidobacteria bacterium]|nr:oligopeptide transporter, OPT family [Acidobacteriota bacterium]